MNQDKIRDGKLKKFNINMQQSEPSDLSLQNRVKALTQNWATNTQEGFATGLSDFVTISDNDETFL